MWTERRLDTLERGIKGGQWYSLVDKVWNESHLLMAAMVRVVRCWKRT